MAWTEFCCWECGATVPADTDIAEDWVCPECDTPYNGPREDDEESDG